VLHLLCPLRSALGSGCRFTCECFKMHEKTSLDVKQGDKMNEMHLIIGSVVATMVLVASVVDLYQLTHSDSM